MKNEYLKLWAKPHLKIFCKLNLLLILVLLIANQANADVVVNNVRLMNKKISLLINVKGKIVDEKGNGIPGVSVKIKGASRGVSTDANGNFVIDAKNGDVLQITAIGYEPREFLVSNTSEVLNISIKESTQGLEDVVVVGFGKQSKAKLSDAVGTIKMDNVMKDRPVSNAGMALEGSIPGLNISIGSGIPGSKATFNLRGYTSINGGAPLLVVDNIPMDDISQLNPADFEDVSILKDASASVLYGARAAFGVILITTKKGKLNTPISFEYAAGFSPTYVSTMPDKLSVREFVDVMKKIGQESWWVGNNIATYDRLLNEYAANPGNFPANGITNVGGQNYSLKTHDAFADYFEGGQEQYHNFTASGGSDKMFFRSSVRYVNENGPVVGDHDVYKRWSTDNTFTAQLTSKLNFQAKIMYNDYKRSEPGDGFGYPFYAMVSQPSFTPTGYDLATVRSGETKLLPYGTQNNLTRLQNPKTFYGNQLRLAPRLVFTPIKDLTITGEYAFDRNTDYYEYVDNRSLIETIQPEYLVHQLIDPNAQTNTQYSKSNSLFNRNSLNIYGKYIFSNLGDHHLDIMAGTNQEYTNFEQSDISRKGLLSITAPSIGSATEPISGGDKYYRVATSGYFSQLHYDYKGKYILQLSGRYDGSSRFLTDKRFGFFPSGSIAWNLMSENFMQPLAKVFNSIKPRMSYGTIGNQVLGDANDPNNQIYYPAIATMDPFDANWLNPANNSRYKGIGTPGLISDAFTWERVTTLGYGLDIAALRNRLNVNFDYFIRTTKGMITAAVPLPAILGTGAPLANAATLESKGFELSIGWNDRIGKVKYNINFNLSDDYGVITDLKNNNGSIWGNYTGKKLGEIWGYESKGLFQIDQFTGLNPALMNGLLTDAAKQAGWVQLVEGSMRNPGDMAYVDLNGDGKIDIGDETINNPGDRKVIGNTSHRYRFGINGSVAYKGFDFSFNINGVAKRQFYSWNNFYHPWADKYQDIMPQNTDFWTPTNPNAHFYRLYPDAGYDQWKSRRDQTRYLQNGAFLRVKNLGLGYSFPESLVQKISLKKLRVFVSAENMFTLDHLPDGVDPVTNDLGSGATYPYVKKFSFGLNVTF
jgi:TonB-linked SusC/RagA family outer membrane protein